MNESLRLGTIAGVRVGINWSVLVIFALIAFSLASGRLPAQYPDLSTATYAVAGFAAAIVFFFSLLAHEIAHAVVARRNGIEVEGITLWLFGGVARLAGEAPDPGADLRIAGVGPLVSLILAAVFGGLFLALGGTDAGIVAGTVGWLAAINLILAIFNLIPAAPLDGGRVLRAVLWRARKDRLSATITASRAGKGFGALLIGLGLVEFAFGAGLGGLWMVMIGWFLINAAASEEQHARLRGSLAGVSVAEVMTADPTVAPAHLSVQQFIDDYLWRHRHSAYPLVSDGGQLAGLLTLNRIRSVPADRRGMTSVRAVAAPPEEVTTATPEQQLVDLLPLMREGSDGRIVVVRDGQVVGIVSPADIARLVEFTDLRDVRDAQHV